MGMPWHQAQPFEEGYDETSMMGYDSSDGQG